MATALTIGFPILASTVISTHWGSRSPAERAHFNPLDPALIGSQIAQLAAVSKLSGTATQAAIDKGKGEFHNSELPLLNEVKADEDEFDHLNVVTSETEQTFLVRISTVQVTALGEDGHSGTLVSVCQTIIVEIRTIVITVVQPPSPGGDGDGGD